MPDPFPRAKIIPDFSGNACQGHTPEDQEKLWDAANRLVNARGLAVRLTGWLSQHVQSAAGGLDALGHRALGAAWDAFAARTSNLPFAAILSGRQTLKIGEIGAARLIAAVVVWLAVIWAHPLAFGVSPLPWSG